MRKIKIILALFASLILLFALERSYSLAYLNETTTPVINHFSGSSFDLTVREEFEKGNTIKENVTVINTGSVPMYVRVKVLPQAQEENEVIIANPIVETNSCFRAIDIQDFEISDIKNWINIDGYYYYQELIEPMEEVVLFQSAYLKENVVFKSNYTPVLTIAAQGVQGNAIEIDGIWNRVAIDEENRLIVKEGD